jgi:hypothetical protein
VKNTASYILTVVLVLGSGDPWAQDRAAASDRYRIAGVQARLYYADDATFSDNVIDNADFALYNVVAGEGSARASSTNLLVLVEVAGPRLQHAGARTVELTALEGKQRQLKLHRASRIGLVESSARTFIAFWLYDTGCKPLLLRARIVGQAEPSTVEKSVPFQCGE